MHTSDEVSVNNHFPWLRAPPWARVLAVVSTLCKCRELPVLVLCQECFSAIHYTAKIHGRLKYMWLACKSALRDKDTYTEKQLILSSDIFDSNFRSLWKQQILAISISLRMDYRLKFVYSVRFFCSHGGIISNNLLGNLCCRTLSKSHIYILWTSAHFTYCPARQISGFYEIRGFNRAEIILYF